MFGQCCSNSLSHLLLILLNESLLTREKQRMIASARLYAAILVSMSVLSVSVIVPVKSDPLTFCLTTSIE